MIERDEIIGERLRSLDRYKAAIERAQVLKDTGKLPPNFDWSKLEEDNDEEIEDLVNI